MLEGRIIKIIENRENERVKYICRGEKNLTFVCGEELGAYNFTVYKLGEILGWKIDYDQEKDEIVEIWKEEYR